MITEVYAIARLRLRKRRNAGLYRVLELACRLLRHPSKRTEFAGGTAVTRCPCGDVEIHDRAFRTTGRWAS